MNNKFNFVTYVNNAVGASGNVLKALKRREYPIAIAHSMVIAQNIVNAIEVFHKLEVEVMKEVERE